jgi:hypothetical protein
MFQNSDALKKLAKRFRFRWSPNFSIPRALTIPAIISFVSAAYNSSGVTDEINSDGT